MVVVIVLTGPLCTKGTVLYAKEIQHFQAFGHLVHMLLGRTHVGIWSRMRTSELEDLLQWILPENIVSRLSFIQGCESSNNLNMHPDREQFFNELFSKNAMRNLLLNHIVVFIDVDPLNPERVSIIYPRVHINATNI